MKKCESLKAVSIIGAFFGVLSFLLIYGYNVLNPFNDAWLLAGGDLAQNHMGWRFFRLSDWVFPFGLMNNITYPHHVSIVYTDSIPLFAIFFKVFNIILPKNFQYFGIFGFISFALQGMLSALIIRRYTINIYTCIVCSLLIILSPVMIWRMYGHTGLAAHFIILFPIMIWVYKDFYFNTIKRNLVAWSILFFITPTIHIYFIPAIVLLLCSYLLRDIIAKKRIVFSLIILSVALSSALLAMYLIGAFSGEMGVNEGGLGHFSANLNALFNPQGWSLFFSNLPTATSGQYEGFGYLGAGLIFGLCVCIYIWIKFLVSNSINTLKMNLVVFSSFWIPILIALFACSLLALSPIITVGSKILFTIPYPEQIYKLLSIFRSSGRYLWPVWYIVAFIIIWTIIKENNSTKPGGGKKTVCVFFTILLCIQVVDLSERLMKIHDRFSERVEYTFGLYSPLWEEIKGQYKNIIFMNFWTDEKMLYDVEYYASANNMTINTTYLSRPNMSQTSRTTYSYFQELEKGKVRDDAIYIFSLPDQVIAKDYPLHIYQVDGFFVGLPHKVIDLEEYEFTKPSYVVPGDNISHNGDNKVFFKGFSTAEATHRWNEGKNARLTFFLDDNLGFIGEISLKFWTLGVQKIGITLNGQEVLSGEWNFTFPGETVIFTFDPKILSDGRNDLLIDIPNANRPDDVDIRVMGFAFQNFMLK